MESFSNYASRLQGVLSGYDWGNVAKLASSLASAWEQKRRVYLCGNGGSAANAMHIANDLLYGISTENGGLKVIALSANPSVLTCLANDISYDEIFSWQLKVQGEPGDVLIVFSGSGNSPNIVKALTQSRKLGMKSFAVLGYSGGKCLDLAGVPIHFPIDDMQIAEDLQLVVGHMVMQSLCANPKIASESS